MNWSRLIRQSHRWVSILFTLTVAANFVKIGLGGDQTPDAITYAPLLPLLLLTCSGLYLFILPYISKPKATST